MDTIIEEEVKARTKKKAAIITLLGMLLVAGSVWALRYSFGSTIKKSSITTAVVERGNVENTISASGEILPEFEETITSPIAASVQNIIMDAGSKVLPGKSILTLDKSASQTAFEKLKFQLESKQNDIKKLKLDLDKSFYDIKSSNDMLSVSKLMEMKAGEKHIAFQYNFEETPFYIYADEQQMEQVLINIVKNAIEAIDETGIITFIASVASKQLIITDTGQGVDDEAASQLFSPFFSTKNYGQGIGLTLIKEILLNHGFEFNLKTVGYRDTRFVIRF